MANLRLAPISEVIFEEASISRFRQNYRKAFGASHPKDNLYESVSAGNKYQGVEHWLPFFHEKLETIFDYLPESIVTLDDNIDAAQTLRWEVISDQFQSRKENLDQKKKVTKEDVNKAYTKIQKKIHPDISPETARLSTLVNEARDILLKEII